MTVPMTILTNLVTPTCGLNKRGAAGIQSCSFHFTISIDYHKSNDVVPRNSHVGPRVQRNISTLYGPQFQFIILILVALKCNLLVFDAQQKLSWIIPVAINCSNLIGDPLSLFNPTGNGETSVVESDDRCKGVWMRLVQKKGLAAKAPSLGERRRSN